MQHPGEMRRERMKAAAAVSKHNEENEEASEYYDSDNEPEEIERAKDMRSVETDMTSRLRMALTSVL